LTGNYKVPTLILDDASVIDDSKKQRELSAGKPSEGGAREGSAFDTIHDSDRALPAREEQRNEKSR
jgi:hypothetical protein